MGARARSRYIRERPAVSPLLRYESPLLFEPTSYRLPHDLRTYHSTTSRLVLTQNSPTYRHPCANQSEVIWDSIGNHLQTDTPDEMFV